MKINKLDHVNICTADLDASVRFYSDILGLRSGPLRAGASNEEFRWLYDDSGAALIHLTCIDGQQMAQNTNTGSVAHIAFECSGMDEVATRLEQRGIDFEMHASRAGNRAQLFFVDINGVTIELTSGAEL